MSKSNKQSAAPVILTLAALTAQREQLAAQALALDNMEVQIRTETETKARAQIDGFAAQMSKALDRPVSIADLANMVKSHAAGKLSFAPQTASSGDKGKRLSDAERSALKADLLKRAIAERTGGTVETLVAIATRHDVSGNTIDNHKPTEAEVVAAVAAIPAPATA